MSPPPIILEPVAPADPDCEVPDGGTGVPVILNEGGDLIPVVPAGPGIQLDTFTNDVNICTPPIDDTPSMPAPLPPAGSLISLGNRVYQFTHYIRVPVQGEMYLFFGGVSTAANAVIVENDFAFRGVTISVDEPDADNDYKLELLVSPGGGFGVVDSLDLPAGSLGALRNDLVGVGAQGNGIGLRIVRTGGTVRKSTFHLITVSLALRDT